MTNHSKALYVLQKQLDKRRNALSNLVAKPESTDRAITLARAGVEAYESSILALRRDEAGELSAGRAYEGRAYERYSPDPVDNEQRAAWAMAAIRHYASLNRWGGEEVVEDGDSEHLDEVAGDLMNDLYHLLADHKLDPQVLHDRATMGYEEERAEEEQDDDGDEDDVLVDGLIADGLIEEVGVEKLRGILRDPEVQDEIRAAAETALGDQFAGLTAIRKAHAKHFGNQS